MKKMNELLVLLILTITLSTTAQNKLPFQLEKDWELTDFENSESVALDSKNNVLYVSNSNDTSTEKNRNSYISKVSLDGKIIQRKWIEKLNAPKGFVVYKDKLYVTDIETQKIKTFKAKDASFLNDITVDNKGNVYVSNTFGFSAIYKLPKKGKRKIELWLKDENLHMPNGLLYFKR